MTTSFTREGTTTTVEPVSAWRLPRFQRFAAITVGSALLFSFVAISCLQGDVDVVTKQQIPYIQEQLSQYSMHR
jgi:hypothetical protein